MKKQLAAFVFATMMALTAVLNAHAQSTSAIGISASIQSSQFDILVPIWLGNHFSISPAVGLVWVKDGTTDIRFAIAPRYYFYKEKFAPYVGARVGVLMASAEGVSGTTDILAGLAGGGEYFLDGHFSLGVEAQFNIISADDNSSRIGSPGAVQANTAAAVFATIYF